MNVHALPFNPVELDSRTVDQTPSSLPDKPSGLTQRVGSSAFQEILRCSIVASVIEVKASLMVASILPEGVEGPFETAAGLDVEAIRPAPMTS